MKRHARRILFGLVALGAALVFGTIQSGRATNSARFAFIDVGQGDSALLSDGSGFNVLVDGGQAPAAPTVLAYLRSQGIHQIDVMVATHSDSDHIGGLTYVLKASDITVKAVVFNGYTATTTSWSYFATAVANDGLVMTPAHFPSSFNWGTLTVLVLNPDPAVTYSDANSESVVVLVQDDNVRLLYTGDIDATTEAQVVARGTPVAAQILKVAHHGSGTSSGADFLSAVGSSEAIISVGPNSYGLPAAEALDRLAEAGARIWRTDQHGTIVIVSDGRTYTLSADVYALHLPAIMMPESTPVPTGTLAIAAEAASSTPSR